MEVDVSHHYHSQHHLHTPHIIRHYPSAPPLQSPSTSPYHLSPTPPSQSHYCNYNHNTITTITKPSSNTPFHSTTKVANLSTTPSSPPHHPLHHTILSTTPSSPPRHPLHHAILSTTPFSPSPQSPSSPPHHTLPYAPTPAPSSAAAEAAILQFLREKLGNSYSIMEALYLMEKNFLLLRHLSNDEEIMDETGSIKQQNQNLINFLGLVQGSREGKLTNR
ncbi:uncharacterized protein LOC134766114 [Penaeus indicus]|uniref:uncharacterized protein LOC134766114 n=1 Tax=Penaeus indicus TaxID=29960 RepID=UPI00300C3E4B